MGGSPRVCRKSERSPGHIRLDHRAALQRGKIPKSKKILGERRAEEIFRALIVDPEDSEKYSGLFDSMWELIKNRSFLIPSFFYGSEVNRLFFTQYGSLKRMNDKRYKMLLFTVLIIRILLVQTLSHEK